MVKKTKAMRSWVVGEDRGGPWPITSPEYRKTHPMDYEEIENCDKCGQKTLTRELLVHGGICAECAGF